MNQSSSDFMDRFRNREWVDRRVPSDYHSHPIVPWAVEEKCYFCEHPASHKVGETDNNPQIHPLTTYVCCEHFWGFCYNVGRKRHGDVSQDSNPV